MLEIYQQYQSVMDPTSPWFILLLLWTLVWKGFALWKAARRGEKVWYVVILVLNTIGILEILYLFAFSKKSKEGQQK